LQWVPLQDARQFDLPFITQVVLNELSTQITTGIRPETVPFFRNNDEDQHLLRLYGGIPH
jgi:hypothetical protein